MYKTISKSLLMALAITTSPLIHASAAPAAKPATGSAWTLTSYFTAAMAAVTPLLAYQCYKSYKAESKADKTDKQAEALHKKLCGYFYGYHGTTQVTIAGVITKREAISKDDEDEIIKIAESGGRSNAQQTAGYRSTIADYNSNRNTLKQSENHGVEMVIEDCLVQNTSGMIEPKFRLRAQKRTTAGYGALAGLTGLTAAGLYFYGKK